MDKLLTDTQDSQQPHSSTESSHSTADAPVQPSHAGDEASESPRPASEDPLQMGVSGDKQSSQTSERPLDVLPSSPPVPIEDPSERVQKVELVGQPSGWAAMADKVRDYDEDKVKDAKEDIDTLMVFVRTHLLMSNV